jgi:hypothetical protein
MPCLDLDHNLANMFPGVHVFKGLLGVLKVKDAVDQRLKGDSLVLDELV